jgi:hypothetical protein
MKDISEYLNYESCSKMSYTLDFITEAPSSSLGPKTSHRGRVLPVFFSHAAKCQDSPST